MHHKHDALSWIRANALTHSSQNVWNLIHRSVQSHHDHEDGKEEEKEGDDDDDDEEGDCVFSFLDPRLQLSSSVCLRVCRRASSADSSSPASPLLPTCILSLSLSSSYAF